MLTKYQVTPRVEGLRSLIRFPFIQTLPSRKQTHLLTETYKLFLSFLQISHYKVPRYIEFVEEYPMTVTGKVSIYSFYLKKNSYLKHLCYLLIDFLKISVL